MKIRRTSHSIFPGLALAVAVTAAAVLLERVETAFLGHTPLGALVLAIFTGSILRTTARLPACCDRGIGVAAKHLLELSVVLMGLSVSRGIFAQAGCPLLAVILGTVIIAIACGYGIGRGLGLPHKMAVLIACGNAICGNSAIAAISPVIDADEEEVTTSIAFTAVLGIAVVILVPLIARFAHLSPSAGGAFAGLTVYAVPQVLAAAGPLGTTAVQLGTLVKLTRVVMLCPVLVLLSLVSRRRGGSNDTERWTALKSFPLFILGFLLLAGLNQSGWVSSSVRKQAHATGDLLTVLAMAGLGLSTDARSIAAAGPRVASVVMISLLILCLLAFGALRILNVS